MKKSHFIGPAAISLISLFLILAWAAAATCGPSEKESQAKPKYIAYYFYTSQRCSTCFQIEAYTQEAIQTSFKDELQSGKLKWKALNVELPENKHFIDDFQLYSKSVIVAEYKDGKPLRWENLKDIWQLVRNEQKYHDYVARETRSFMEKK